MSKKNGDKARTAAANRRRIKQLAKDRARKAAIVAKKPMASSPK